MFFGFFNAQQPGGTGRPPASFGMNFDCIPTGERLAVYVITGQNQVTGPFITRYEVYQTPEEYPIKRPTPIKNDGTHYHWKLDYDPAANGGNGQFQFSIKSDSAKLEDFEGRSFLYDPAANAGHGRMKVRLGGESVTLDLKAGAKAQGAVPDRFGLVNVGTGGGAVKLYLDDLQYSAAKP